MRRNCHSRESGNLELVPAKAGMDARLRGHDMAPRAAFTLIELMIVIVIIAAIAAMIVPRLSGRSEQAKAAVAQADISSNISMALKLYELDNGSFPTTDEGLGALYTKPASASGWHGPYLEKKAMDPWGNPYQYKCPGAHNAETYDLYSMGKDGADGTADDVKNWE